MIYKIKIRQHVIAYCAEFRTYGILNIPGQEVAAEYDVEQDQFSFTFVHDRLPLTCTVTADSVDVLSAEYN